MNRAFWEDHQANSYYGQYCISIAVHHYEWALKKIKLQ
ncbi:MAG: ClbS/DfsB family four-helix bundle protein [Bacilli bacterium]|nr:ClbS/DfsB family four-helix bundle protein [Bacilli bacterium]